jgi:hypothetical protein
MIWATLVCVTCACTKGCSSLWVLQTWNAVWALGGCNATSVGAQECALMGCRSLQGLQLAGDLCGVTLSHGCLPLAQSQTLCRRLRSLCSQRRCSVVQWNPEVATQLLVASDDDRSPTLQVRQGLGLKLTVNP